MSHDESMSQGPSPVTDRVTLPAIALVSAAVVGLVAFLVLGHRPAPGERGEIVTVLPALNAGLNGLSAALLTLGFVFIRQRRITAHRACMVGAFAVSILFLVSYVTYHYLAGSRPFPGQGWIRPAYFALLISHIVLAAAILPLALLTLLRAVSGQFQRHAAIARWTLPLWLYVSITGVLVYVVLYHFVPS